MNEIAKRWLCAGARGMVAFVLSLPLSALAQEACEADGVVFGFFNGVQTTKESANNALVVLGQLYPSNTPAGKPITYELFYNDTQGFSDFVETFEQRLQEQNGLLAGRFELFFSAAKGEGGWWDALIEAIPALGNLLKSLFDTFLAKLMQVLTSQFGNPSLAEVSARHQAQINHWASLNQKMLFLAHSQGNLFVNQAYTHAVGKTGNEYVRVVHVAPASPSLSGRHSLADKDIVINGLRLTGTVAPNTDVIQPYVDRPPGLNGARDLIGHGLLEIYLNPAVPTSGRIRNDVMTALRELDAAPRRPMPPYPDFVYRDWQGGLAPAAVYAPHEASHKLEKVVEKDTAGVLWKFSEYRGWSKSGLLPYSGVRQASTHYLGEGMNGYVECAYGVPLEGFADSSPSIECTYQKVPIQMHMVEIQLGTPAELVALGDVPDGTVVHLNEMTYSGAFVNYSVSYVNTSVLKPFIEFQSGFLSRWSSQLEDKHVWREPFWAKAGALLNHEALLAHSEAFRMHEEAEYERSQQHALLRWEYEQRRMTCESPSQE
ncbi:hypothetical protein [Hydrogenophaga sp.]|uniref:hypothetical protein n=1 Tax=Hydrogenophaga sp. TaxID=1904254 RepID=UPI0025B96F6F|nr:hypothetical protein [Hydrogenophaga sp.]MBT9464722.1 hypothetical protein [Hydrogenophaga sp.]